MANDPAAFKINPRHLIPGPHRIYWRLRSGSPWADIPERYGPSTTCYNRFVRWAKNDVWDGIFEAISKAYDGDLQMIDGSSIRVHRHGANGKKILMRGTAARLGRLSFHTSMEATDAVCHLRDRCRDHRPRE